MDFQTCFVYFSLILCMLLFAKRSVSLAKTGKHITVTNYTFFIPILVFSLVIGLRYMVGIDYERYLMLIEDGASDFYFQSIEPVYQYLILFIEKHSLHFSFFFILSAFIQIFFFYKAFDRPLLFLLPWAIPLFIMTEIGSLENGVRHFTALLIFFYSLKHIKNQKLVYYIITVLLASLFHKSVLICFPLYFFTGREIIKSVYLRFGLVLFFLLASSFLRGQLLSISAQLIVVLGYGNYLDADKLVETGLGIYVIWIVNFILIGFYPKLKDTYHKNGFLIYWNIFYIGLLLKPLLDYIQVFSRMNWYFYKFRFLIIAFLLHYLFHHRKNPVNMFFFVFVLLIMIVLFIYNIIIGSEQMSPFYFIWDQVFY